MRLQKNYSLKFKSFFNPVYIINNYLNSIQEKLLNKNLKKINFYPINEVLENDIFIVGYPKSGNTWMQNLISSILYCPDASLFPDKIVQEIVPDVHFKKYYKRFGEIIFFKSHELPKENYRNVIYLVRDGRDAMVSYYHMNKIQGSRYTLKDMVVKGEGVYPCKWHIHVKSWLENPFNANLIVIKYEDLIQNPLAELRKICDFANILREDSYLERAVETNSFKFLQKKEEKYGFDNDNWKGNKTDKKFFRKGKAGSYVEEMNIDTQKYFVKEAENELRKLKYI